MSLKLKSFLHFLNSGIIVLSLIFLAGCSSVKGVYSQKCQRLQLQYKLAHKLESDGIQVIRLGDTVTLILPSNKFFYTGSDNFSSTRHLNTVIQFLNAYTTEDIQVRGYEHSGVDQTR